MLQVADLRRGQHILSPSPPAPLFRLWIGIGTERKTWRREDCKLKHWRVIRDWHIIK